MISQPFSLGYAKPCSASQQLRFEAAAQCLYLMPQICGHDTAAISPSAALQSGSGLGRHPDLSETLAGH